MTDSDTDLGDFGVDADVPEPLLERKAPKYIETDERRLVGFMCYEHNRSMRAYTTRRSRFHYYRNGEGYAISEAIIDYLAQLDVDHIFIHEKPRDDPDFEPDAFEFRTRQYRFGENVPESELYDDQDAQVYVPVADAIRTWPGVGETMFKREFGDAMDYLNSRSRGERR
jgi:hypothetical protein